MLGTDGFGRSDTCFTLKKFFEVDRYHIVVSALYALYLDRQIDINVVSAAREKYGIDSNKPNPWDV